MAEKSVVEAIFWRADICEAENDIDDNIKTDVREMD
jgi:hypothetical protein